MLLSLTAIVRLQRKGPDGEKRSSLFRYRFRYIRKSFMVQFPGQTPYQILMLCLPSPKRIFNYPVVSVIKLFWRKLSTICVNYAEKLKSMRVASMLRNIFSSLQMLRSISQSVCPGKTKGGSITVLLTSCLTGLESAV